jgi:NADPH:quinone reductase-like Zn-dependent oxidoreductase
VSRTSKVLSVTFVVMAIALVTLGIVLSHESPCDPVSAPAGEATLMKAIVSRCYGPPQVLEYADLAKPAPADDELLVRVHAAGVNPLDWHTMRGKPYLMRLESGIGKPQEPRLGVDFAGTVEAVGKNVTRFHVGDEVFGGATGAFAQYVVVREDRAVTLKPANVTFEQAASVPIAALTALQALRDKGRVQPGQKVLINGASGGVGTFAVQIAKSLGADVTGVCSTRNVEMVRSLGADRVVDYTRENFTQSDQQYDVIVDNVSNHSLLDYRRVLKPDGILVIIGSTDDGPWLGPLKAPLKAFLVSPFVSQDATMLLAVLKQADLDTLRDLMQSSKMTPVIDRRYALSETREAIAYVEEGRARGKVVIDFD